MRDPDDLDESDEDWWERVGRKRKEEEKEEGAKPRKKGLPPDFRFTHFLHGGKPRG